MKPKRIVSILLIAIMLLSLAACGGEGENNTDRAAYNEPAEFDGEAHDVRVFFVNVGKADCAVVDVDGHIWLVDAGTEESFTATYAALRLLGATSIDGAILTHEHADHIGGIEPLSALFPIAKAVYPAFLMSPRDIEDTLIACSIPGTAVKAGDSVDVCDGVRFEVLAPERQLGDNDNDNSLVVMLRANGRSFLFTGDMQNTEDAVLVSSGRDILCDVLKVPNHGNPDASSEAFVKAADPLISVISTDTSVDANSANRRVTAKLAGSEIFITQNYELGVLVSVSRKGEISVSFPSREAKRSGAEIIGASKDEQTFTVKNTSGGELDLSGWFVWSTRGFEVFRFPDGTVLPPDGTLLVACLGSDLDASVIPDLTWNVKKAWAGKKDDDAVLCDPFGNEVSRRASE